MMNDICSRRAFLSAVVVAPLIGARPALAGRDPRSEVGRSRSEVSVVSPDGRVRYDLQDGVLSHRLTFGRVPALESSRLGITVDGIDLGVGAEVQSVDHYEINESFACRGVHSIAVNHCNGAGISLKHAESETSYTLDVRAFNDGIAFRFVVPGDGSRVPDEATAFTVPRGSIVWYHDFHGHYEGSHERKPIAQVAAGDWAAPPLTVKLPDGAGYAAITEAALMNYAGMGLQADGRGGFDVRLGHAHPPSYPFTLRYGDEEAVRLAVPAAVTGTITTPWRVVLLGSDLNDLVNSDVIQNVSPAADRRLFPSGIHTEWIRPGRSVWQYLDGGERTLDGMKEFSRLAAQLGFEYNLIEGFWQRWSESELLELVDFSRGLGVGIWLWKHTRDLRAPEARREFFSMARDVGVVGVKLDFFDHEAREIVDLYQALLQDAAEQRLMVNFHGANKPTGEARTWPNEMSREAISGMERRSMQAWAGHNATQPFTRMLAGHADFTPVHFGERRRETSWAHQIASAAILTAPILVYGAHPASMLANPAVEMIKSIPSVWDETVVMPVSEIGEIAAFARRHGDDWFLAVMNGPDARSVDFSLEFLEDCDHDALLVRDEPADSGAVIVENVSVGRCENLSVDMRPGGGFIARFRQVKA